MGEQFEYKFKKNVSIIILKVMATQAYCVKCKAKREMKNEKPVTMKNGRSAISGVCSTCGTKMFKIGGGTATTTPSRKAKIPVKHATKKKQSKAVKRKKK